MHYGWSAFLFEIVPARDRMRQLTQSKRVERYRNCGKKKNRNKEEYRPHATSLQREQRLFMQDILTPFINPADPFGARPVTSVMYCYRHTFQNKLKNHGLRALCSILPHMQNGYDRYAHTAYNMPGTVLCAIGVVNYSPYIIKQNLVHIYKKLRP